MANWRFISVEGVIGVGKTSLATLLSKALNGKVLLEEADENPFLPKFYEDPERFSFATQVFFLLSRYNSLKSIIHREIFSKVVISDYMFAKDRIFATVNLKENELNLYNKIYNLIEKDIPYPDLVIFLQADVETLIKRIKKRGRHYEMSISADYLKDLIESYNEFFFHYEKSPVLIVNTKNADFLMNREHLNGLIKEISQPLEGIRYFSPGA